MAKITVDPELCKSCRLCLPTCPKKILRIGQAINSKGYPHMEQFDAERCTACRMCAVMCPESAIEVWK